MRSSPRSPDAWGASPSGLRGHDVSRPDQAGSEPRETRLDQRERKAVPTHENAGVPFGRTQRVALTRSNSGLAAPISVNADHALEAAFARVLERKFAGRTWEVRSLHSDTRPGSSTDRRVAHAARRQRDEGNQVSLAA